MKKAILLIVCVAAVITLLQSLSFLGTPFHSGAEIRVTTTPVVQAAPLQYEGKKILWVSSYHQGYEANDAIERGIRKSIQGSGVQLKTFFMDTKRNNSHEFGEEAGRRAFAFIREYEPDVIIASDDNAQKYLVVPYLKGGMIPVVFCGVNWDASQYGYPAVNVTGMVEVDLAQEMYDLMRRHAGGDRIGYLSGDVEIERAIATIYNDRFFHHSMKSYLVSSMAEFKDAFLRAQKEVDMLYLYNYTGIHDWDPVEAELFLSRRTRIPTGSHNGFMAPFVSFVVAKSLQEHGEWGGIKALEILGGRDVADIPLTTNSRAELYVNMRMAKSASLVLPVSILKTATVIGRNKAYLDPEPGEYLPGEFKGRKIFWLDSYQPDYEWSRGLEAGIRSILYDTGASLEIFHMDSKNNPDSQTLDRIGEEAYKAILKAKPDIVIASDDNAQAYVVTRYLKKKGIPVVFCGVNWDASQYGYPTENITGMLEVDMVDELLHYLSLFAKGDRVARIGGDAPTERKNQEICNERYFNGRLVSYLVTTMDEFEEAVIDAQKRADMLVFANYSGIRDWDGDRAVAFLRKHNSLPAGTHLEFMSDYVVFTVAKVAKEQGSHAARTALDILDGTKPSGVPVVTNKIFDLTINLQMAKAAGIVLPFHLLQRANLAGRVKTASMQ